MRKFYLINCLIVLYLLLGLSASAQKVCGFDKIRAEQFANNPQLEQAYEAFEAHWQRVVAMQDLSMHRKVVEGTDTIYELPIVVHVMHTGGAIGSNYNRSDADIHAWINYTNAVFAGTAAGMVGPGAGGARIPIRLVLAKRSPTCDSTSGIVRVNASSISGYSTNGVESSLSGSRYSAMKALSRWDPTRYYNIYLVNKIDGEDGYTSSSYIAGYATMPPVHAGEMYSNALSDDGSVMLSYIAESGETTFAHELGHALSLLHTFEGATSYTSCPPAESGSACATSGDRVCDTERGRALLGVACPTNSTNNPCTGVNYNGVQYNIMNYSNCPNRFTPGQAERVKQSLLFFRSNLINSNALDPVTATTVPVPVTPTFVPSGTNTVTSMLGVANVKLSNLDYQSLGSFFENNIKYKDNTGTDCRYYAGQVELLSPITYTLQVSTQDLSNNQSIRAAIDFNNNGSFESSEYVFAQNNVPAGNYSASFTLPPTVVKDTPLRMRVKADFHSGSSTVYDLGINPVYGQIEDFTVIVRDEPLSSNPIHFLVNNMECTNELKWRLVEGASYVQFDVERSIDGVHFQSIGTSYFTEGQMEYVFKDAGMGSSKYLYRLAVTNMDGSIEYTPVRTAVMNCFQEAVVFPNPTDGKLQVTFNAVAAQQAVIKVLDINGKIVQSEKISIQAGANQQILNIGTHAAGAYIIRIEMSEGVFQKMVTKY